MVNNLSRKAVCISIVSRKREDLLLRCLESIAKQTHKEVSVSCFLNEATGEDLERLKGFYPHYAFAYSPTNDLYAGPHNRAIRQCEGDFVLCLNDDVVLAEDFVREGLKAFLCDERLGAVSGCLLREDGVTIDSTGLFLSRSRKACDRGYGKTCDAAYLRPQDVFGVNGAAAFYRRAMLEDIKCGSEYFDEDFGIFYEDLDLAWRARRSGWRVLYVPTALATHKRGATTRAAAHAEAKAGGKKPNALFDRYAIVHLNDDLKTRLVRNRIAMMLKNESLASFLCHLPWIVFYEVRLLVYLLFFSRGVLKRILQERTFVAKALSKRSVKGTGLRR